MAVYPAEEPTAAMGRDVQYHYDDDGAALERGASLVSAQINHFENLTTTKRRSRRGHTGQLTRTTSDAGSLSYDEPSDVGASSFQHHYQQDAEGTASSEDRAMLFDILQRALVEKEEALRRAADLRAELALTTASSEHHLAASQAELAELRQQLAQAEGRAARAEQESKALREEFAALKAELARSRQDPGWGQHAAAMTEPQQAQRQSRDDPSRSGSAMMHSSSTSSGRSAMSAEQAVPSFLLPEALQRAMHMATAWDLRMTHGGLHAAAKPGADNTALLNQLHLLLISLPPSTEAIIVDGPHWTLSSNACTRFARAFTTANCRASVRTLHMGPTPLTTSAVETICRAMPMLSDAQFRILPPKAGLLMGRRTMWRPAIDLHRLQALELHCVRGAGVGEGSTSSARSSTSSTSSTSSMGSRSSRAIMVMDLKPFAHAIQLRQLWLQADAFEHVGVVSGLPHLEGLRMELMGREGADIRASGWGRLCAQ